MDIDVRPFEGEPRTFFEAGELAFGERLRDEDATAYESTFEPDRAIAAYDGERVVGTAGIFSFDFTIPGGVVPAAGVTFVGVQPTHRRRGVLRRMMRMQLDAIHDRGESIAVLWASEGSIYQRFGYGLSTIAIRFGVELERAAFRAPHTPSGTIRFVDVEEAKRVFPPVLDAVAPTRPGFFARTPAFWDAEVFRDPEHWRRGASAAFYVVHDVAGEVDGFARYRVRDAWEDSGPRSVVIVTEKLGLNPAADLDLWRFLLDIDLMAKLEYWNAAADDPLILSALEPRRLGLGYGDGLWLRVVDVSAALAQRRYAADGRLVLEVSDEFCPWNDGRWALTVEDGTPRVEPAADAADLALDVTDLGATYLGGFPFVQLADAARVRELQPGALTRADTMFRTPRQPWCPRVF
ncbi:MAG: GNAT family N-acetyltransferase [Chloroflexota bacterium]|nr:GNAT family N-acetyltransferase [Chloroflexota bacterium]